MRRAHGLRREPRCLIATACGGALAGIGGSFLSLFYPGSWNEGLSSGQGLMAVALVIFARWDPVRCLFTLRSCSEERAPSVQRLQSVGVTSGYYLFNAAPTSSRCSSWC